jgi:hypothetical protein
MVKGKYPISLIRHTTFTPAACAALADAIDDALDVFNEWELPTGMNTRLAKAKNHLLGVADGDSYGKTPEELLLTANAIRLANDFYLISRTLKTDRAEPIAKELESALHGPFIAVESKRIPAVDFQSQFWIGVVLAYAGLHPKMPVKDGRTPDFIISPTSLECGVEIKRPEAPHTAFDCVASAASQIRSYGVPGVIALDLSRCIRVDDFILTDDAAAAMELMQQRFFLLSRKLRKNIETYSLSDKFKRVLLLICFARYFIWTPEGKTDEINKHFISFEPFKDSCEGLITEVPGRIVSLFLRGMERASGNTIKIYQN